MLNQNIRATYVLLVIYPIISMVIAKDAYIPGGQQVQRCKGVRELQRDIGFYYVTRWVGSLAGYISEFRPNKTSEFANAETPMKENSLNKETFAICPE